MGIFRTDPQPFQRPPRVPPAALITGDQPPRIGNRAVASALAASAWQPPVTLATTLTRDESAAIIPQTVTSDPPPVNSRNAGTIAITTRYDWPTFTGLPFEPMESASWQPAAPPPVSQPAIVRIPAAVLAAWNALVARPAFDIPTVPIGIIYGDQPPARMSVAVRDASSWQQGAPVFVTQFVILPGAITDSQPYVVTPSQILAAWRAAPQAPPVPNRIAPLTLVYGQQPMPTAFFSVSELAQLARAWDPYPPRPPALEPTAPWNFTPPEVDAPPPRASQFAAVLIGWQRAPTMPLEGETIAPLTVTPPSVDAPMPRRVVSIAPPDAIALPFRATSIAPLIIVPPIALVTRAPASPASWWPIESWASRLDAYGPRGSMVALLPIGPVIIVYVDEPLFIDFDLFAGRLLFPSPSGRDMLILTMVQNEVDDIVMHLLGKNNAPQDLTGVSTLGLTAWDNRIADFVPIINGRSITVVDAPSGTATYRPQPSEVATAGKFEAEVVAIYPDGTKRKFPGLVIIEPSPTG